jgi:hypothetical protein
MNTTGRFPRVLEPHNIIILLLILLCLLPYLSLLNYTEPTEVGVARNIFSGEMWLQEGGGWHTTAPWVRVARIDTRPMRLAITSAGHGYNAKLVQFELKYWREFVETEGFRYWWWANRISFNWGYDEEYRGMRDILRGYAFSNKRYQFLTTLEQYNTK